MLGPELFQVRIDFLNKLLVSFFTRLTHPLLQDFPVSTHLSCLLSRWELLLVQYSR